MDSDPPPRVRMLWIVPKFPLGNPDGARQATCSLVRELTQRQVRVDLICLVPEGEPANHALAKEQLGVASCSIIRRSRAKWWPIPDRHTPFTFRSFATRKVRKQFAEQFGRFRASMHSTETTYVVFDGLHAFAALEGDVPDLSASGGRVIYRAHNVETVLWEQCAERARFPWTRWFFQYQAALVRAFEIRIARQVNVIAPVSEEDAKRFERFAPGATVSVTRIGMEFSAPQAIGPVAAPKNFELLFIGRLDWLPNRAGLQWFLEKVWPTVVRVRPAATLKIAGTGDGGWLAKYQGLTGLTILGRVEKVEPLYESSVLCLAPLFQGSGTRVKLIESARYRRAAISTALGAEGTGLVPGASYYRAETADEWIALLQTVTIDDCRTMGQNAYHAVCVRFDGRGIAGQLLKSLELSGERA